MLDDLEIKVFKDERGKPRQCPAPGYDGRLRTCKSWRCPRCAPAKVADWRRHMEQNLGAYGRPVVLVTITAPGAERLPWDDGPDAPCAHRKRHKVHRGPDGCRVQQRAAREWCDTLTWRWAKLRDAARKATIDACKVPPTLLERAYEPQKRGVPHLHLVLGYGSPAEIDAAHCFAAELKARASRYDFGFVDAKADPDAPFGVRLKPMAGAEAARYLASYLVGRTKKSKSKSGIRENIALRDSLGHPVMPRSLIWLTPRLTSIEERCLTATGQPTFVTIRMLRRARHLYAAARGVCTWPVFTSLTEAIKVGLVCRRVYRRGAEDDDPSDFWQWLQLGRRADAVQKRDLRRFWAQQDERTRFAFLAAGLNPGQEAA